MIWVGGVSIVTSVVVPAVRRGDFGADRLAAFQAIERRFVWQARAAIIIVGLQLNFFTKDFTFFGHAVRVKFLDLPVWLAGIFTALSGFGLVVDGIAQLHSRGHGEGGFTGGTGKALKEDV